MVYCTYKEVIYTDIETRCRCQVQVPVSSPYFPPSVVHTEPSFPHKWPSISHSSPCHISTDHQSQLALLFITRDLLPLLDQVPHICFQHEQRRKITKPNVLLFSYHRFQLQVAKAGVHPPDITKYFLPPAPPHPLLFPPISDSTAPMITPLTFLLAAAR